MKRVKYLMSQLFIPTIERLKCPLFCALLWIFISFGKLNPTPFDYLYIIKRLFRVFIFTLSWQLSLLCRLTLILSIDMDFIIHIIIKLNIITGCPDYTFQVIESAWFRWGVGSSFLFIFYRFFLCSFMPVLLLYFLFFLF